ncbi:MAG: alpha-amylase family glycosyl hydrolase [Clostridia bacterium]|nr:alpha-amylase family glycosyl hydrolase [Clostridia bacterium]
MKKFVCFLAALICVCSAALAADFDLPVQYPLNENGEATVNDVDFSAYRDTDDNNRVFYEIFVGSFSDSDGDGIGDLRGIINRIDYLNDGDPQSGASLGIEGLWLTPIFSSSTYHKYDVNDFYAVDPSFGTMDDLKELIALCHERNVKLILDFPINHTGTQNRWFKNFINAHLMNNPDNDYYDFYVWRAKGDAMPAGRHFSQYQNTGIYFESNFADTMPELNFDNALVKEALLNAAKFYLELGIDGFRFDAAKYIYYGDNASSAAFWAWYIGELKQMKPELYTVAEVWDGDSIIDQYIPFTNCFNFTTSQTSGLIAETAKAGDVNRFTAYVEQYQNKIRALRDDAQNTFFIANHDTDRAAGYLTVASGQMKMAANLYLLSPGSPFIYYGEEIGLRGARGGANTDANRRLAMLWGDGDAVKNPVGSTYDASKQTPYSVSDLFHMSDGLYNYYKRLIMIRKANPEIARGEYTALTVPDSKAGGFLVTWEGGTVAVFHNTTQRTVKFNLSQVTDQVFTVLSASIGIENASFDGTILTLGGQTSAVLR